MIISLKKRFLLIISAGFIWCAALERPIPAAAELTYKLTGYDRLAAGEPTIRSAVAYDGFEYLRIVQNPGDAKRLYVDVDFRMSGNGQSSRLYAHATETVSGEHDQIDVDGDPLNLTLLAQPFGVQLGRRTLSEIAQLHASVPFASRSPLTGAKLNGSLQHGIDGTLGGDEVLVLRFDTRGLMGGTALGSSANARGSVHMSGVACYRRTDGLLLKLDTLLTVLGRTGPDVSPRPISIAYKRTIRVYGQAPRMPVAYHILRRGYTIAAHRGP